MKLSVILFAGLLVPAAPALAESVIDTHTEVMQPGGKVPTKLYRPIARNACATAAHHHQAGKLPRAPISAANCGAELASRDQARSPAASAVVAD